ncbi:hypothetical protein H5410_060207 [Solanum commersonii]|uniref:Uncharacterized protein n=1 Tax=Solanum commersonii TaxID=4109 RepID=A0A9J5W4T9_SOLCO|nr:hypothetical protein H5410_060207 [Solanum commersonii]
MTCSKCHQVGHNKRTCKSVTSKSFSYCIALLTALSTAFSTTLSAVFSTTSLTTLTTIETSRVEGRKKQKNSSSTRASSSFGRKSRRDVEFGVYTDIQSGRQVINPGRSSERVISSGTTLKDASQTNVDLGFKPPSLKWKGKEAMTGNQLQQMQQRKKIQIKSKWIP